MGQAQTCAAPTLQTISERLADIGIATFRYQFPYMERGGGGRESEAVALQTVRSAAAAAHEAASDLSHPRRRTLL